MAQILFLLAAVVFLAGAVSVWIPSRKPRAMADRIFFSAFCVIMAGIIGLVAIAPDAALSFFNY